MIILGIDPGTTRIGFGELELNHNTFQPIEYGLLEKEKILIPLSENERLYHIGKCLEKRFQSKIPHVLCLESLIFGKNVKTFASVSQIRGILIYFAQKYQIPLQEILPRQVKQSITGNANATKKQIQKSIQKILNLETIPYPDDVSDALAIGIAGSLNFQFKLNLNKLTH